MAIGKVFIVGSGLMGSGIAQVCAQVGIQVFMNDISQEILNKGLKNVSWSVGKFVEKGKLKESLETIMARIKTGTDFAAGATVTLDGIAATDIVVASATSITALGAMGGPRFDHALANVWLLAHPAAAHREVVLLDAAWAWAMARGDAEGWRALLADDAIFAGRARRRMRSSLHRIDDTDDEQVKAVADRAFEREGYGWDVL